MYNYYKQDSQFYPTPVEVIDRIMMDEDVTGKKVLEPSAGTGNIVRWCMSHGAREVVAYEIDEYLRRIVSHECKVIGDDFLKATEADVVGVDYVIMNPPFHCAAEHINHAYEIAPEGATIIALCNHNVFANKNFRPKAEEFLMENCRRFGEHYNLGSVFEDADRTTKCEIECVKLFKPGSGENIFDGFIFDENPDDAGNGTQGLMKYDIVRDVVQRYIDAVKLFSETYEMTRRINDLARFPDDVLKSDEKDANGKNRYIWEPSLPCVFRCLCSDKSVGEIRDVYDYKKALQKYYWQVILHRMDLSRYATAKLSAQIADFIEHNANRPFTMHNIYKMLNVIVLTSCQRMEAAVVEAFDYICSLSAKNSTAGEKWKTNANYMVNKRFICDRMTRYDKGMYKSVNCNTDYALKMDDVTKALCYLTGRNFDEIGRLNNCCHKNTYKWGEWFEWGFFRCKGFFKGTMHFEFLDDKVWQLFNQTAAKSKGWNLGQK